MSLLQYYKEEKNITDLDKLFTEQILNFVNMVFTSVFTVECILKIFAFNPKVCLTCAHNFFPGEASHFLELPTIGSGSS